MGFWDDKLGPAKQPEPVNPAPGGWWQTQQQQQNNYAQTQAQQAAQQNMPHQQPGTMQEVEYAPQNSAFVRNRTNANVDDYCPRCGSYDYVEIRAEGAAGSVYMLPAKRLTCMVCNYPGLDTSEGVMGSVTGSGAGVNMSSSNVQVTKYKVKEQGGRNQSQFQGFDSDGFNRDTDTSHVVKIL